MPACRRAGIPIIWLGWGLREDGLDSKPPAIVKGFEADTNFDDPSRMMKLGEDIGTITLANGIKVDGGKAMMRKQWNTEFYSTLADTAEPNDIWMYKNRLSGFWGGTGIEEALESKGIRTLLFAAANEDQCVAGSLQDAFTKVWDCLLLSDGAGTWSPPFAKKAIEFNCEGGWDFVLTCEQLANVLDNRKCC